MEWITATIAIITGSLFLALITAPFLSINNIDN